MERWTTDVFGELLLTKLAVAISNHSMMLGGGEHSFLDFLSHLPDLWNVLAVVPGKGELSTKLEHRGIKTEVVPMPSIRPWHLLSILSSLNSFFNLFRKYRPALIYANGSRAALYGGILGRLLNLPIIWHCRVAESDPYLDFVLARLSDKIIVNSKFAVNRFPDRFHRKIEVTYNGVDISWLRQNGLSKPKLLQQGWKIILMVARASRSKRHDLTIAAFEELAKSDSKSHLVFLGSRDPTDPQWWNNLHEKTGNSSFFERIHWIGEVEDVRPWYQAATLSILPADMESFGRVLIEAMACGVPVVATLVGGIPEIVRHGEDGILIEPGKFDQIVCAMEKILKDEPMRKRLSKSARERAEFFSLDSHVKKMVQIFDDSIKHPS
jgi:glycosyltransferase involved in cell wall biosynthesis